MKKLFSFFAAMLVAVAVNAQTDFAAPGYKCAADDAVLSGTAGSKLYLDETTTPHQVVFSDISISSTAVATWTVTATRGCYVSVAMEMGTFIGSSNKHIFDVKIYDSKNVERGHLSQGSDHTGASTAEITVTEAFDGTILLPTAGEYRVEIHHNRDWCKGSIRNVILTYAADAPAELIEVSAVELNKTELTLDLQEVELLVATVSPDNATDPSVTWESDNEEVATVSATGLVKAIAEGTANITAKAGEQEAVCAVTVAAAEAPSTDFAEPFVFSGKNAHIQEGYVEKTDEYNLHYLNKLVPGIISWQITVTKPCVVSGVVNGAAAPAGHWFELDLYDSEDNRIDSVASRHAKKWDGGDIPLDSVDHNTLTFPAAGTYTLKLRNEVSYSGSIFAGLTLTFVEDVAPAIENGYYIVGSMNEWQVEAEYKMDLNEEVEEGVIEYMYNTIFAIGDEFKVVEYTDGNWSWHPDNTPNYIIDAKHAGATTVYFRPNGKQDDEAWFYTVIYVVPTSSTAISNTADEETITKRIENGQIVIIKNGVKFNVVGSVVK